MEGVCALHRVVQCLTTYVYARLASDFCRVWGVAVQCEPADVAMQMVQVHKDGAASIESSRQQVFTASRSVDDFAHLLRMLRPKLQAKMRGTVSVPTGTSKVQQTILWHYNLLIKILHILRNVPTVDLFSALWKPWKSPTCVVRTRSSGPFANVGSRSTGVKPSTTISKKKRACPETDVAIALLRTLRHGACDDLGAMRHCYHFRQRTTTRSGSNASTLQRWYGRSGSHCQTPPGDTRCQIFGTTEIFQIIAHW